MCVKVVTRFKILGVVSMHVPLNSFPIIERDMGHVFAFKTYIIYDK